MNDRPKPRRRDTKGAESFAKLYERPLPYAAEAEMAVLGSMLLDPRVVPEVQSFIGSPQDFFEARHGLLYQTLLEVYDTVPDADLVAIVDALRGKSQLDEIGGPDYIQQLVEGTPSAAGASRYAKLVSDKARLRRLIEASDQIIHDALNAGDFGLEGAREVVDVAEQLVFDIAQESQKSDPQALAQLLDIELEKLENADGKGISGLPTGFTDLDRMTSGLQPGEMVILAARPSMGKSAIALNIAEQVARGGRTPDEGPKGPHAPVAIFSLEMSKSSLVQRLMSAFSQVDSQKIRTAQLSAAERATIRTCAEGLQETPIYIDDTPGLTILQLRSRARRMVAQFGIRCLIVDYLQLLTSPGAARESRQVEVSAISRGLKALARELNCPIICLSQLNRASETREGNRPRMSDLRESGSIEQDADVVILLHREDYYHVQDPEWQQNNPDKVNVAELIIAKQRSGPTGIVTLTWDSRTTRFRNHAGSHYSDHSFSAGGSSPFDTEPKFPAGPKAPEPIPGNPPPRSPFGGPKSGPISNHRDGGGPEAPFDDDAGAPF